MYNKSEGWICPRCQTSNGPLLSMCGNKGCKTTCNDKGIKEHRTSPGIAKPNDGFFHK